MDSRIMQAFQKEITCPLCMKYFIDPITLACGHSFCRPCVYLGWHNLPDHVICSECKQMVQKRNFKTNICMKKLAAIVRKNSLWQFLSSEEHMCGAHKEMKKIFCEEGRNFLCLLCSKSQEHEAHKHWPIEIAAEEHREIMVKKMQCLWDKYCETYRNLTMEILIMGSWENYINLRREAIRVEYGKMSATYYEEECHHLERLQKESKDIFEQLKESKTRMAHMTAILRGMYEELKEICHRPDVELLQVFGDILHRIESMQLYIVQPVNPELSARPITGLIDRLNFFQVDITLCPERVNCHVFLYGELRNLNVGCYPQGASWITPTSECFLAWGTHTFTTGRYYWEVEVGDSWNWALGVCNDYWKKNRNYKMDEVEGLFLLGCVKEGSHCTLFTTSPLVLQYVPRPIGRIGVFLDYEGRMVSFINVAQSSLIHSILSCSFSPRLKPVVCCSHI
ncbi:tripartite motif-containing protein 51-like [Callospermophilus lateralis]|uniref:tripartite motif-containing protein 51-like n=1 Tax=Callospermophilus lateralis TaxID=76772 RepID=UPI0040541AE7